MSYEIRNHGPKGLEIRTLEIIDRGLLKTKDRGQIQVHRKRGILVKCRLILRNSARKLQEYPKACNLCLRK